MQLHTENRYHVAFFLSHEELTTAGLREDQADGDWTRQITLRVLNEMGVPAQGVLEIEAFPGQGGVMVFASLCPDNVLETFFFLFDALDDVIRFCALLPRAPRQSVLAKDRRKYLLSVSDTGARLTSLCHIASEFAERIYRPPAFLSFLREQGHILVHQDAAGKLARLG